MRLPDVSRQWQRYNNSVQSCFRSFNQVQQIYQLENISVVLSSMYVWTVNDPYDGLTTSNDYLTTFQTIRPVFNGDLAHLLTTHSTSVGGIAWLDVLCNPSYAYAFSPIDNSLQIFLCIPQSVKAIAHEIGHNLGSNHTQWCGWTGGALDNCSPPEGSCLPGPVPPTVALSWATVNKLLPVWISQMASEFNREMLYVPVKVLHVSAPAIVVRRNNICFTFRICLRRYISDIYCKPGKWRYRPAYLWKINGILFPPGSNSYSTATLTNGDTVTCEMQSNDLCALGITKCPTPSSWVFPILQHHWLSFIPTIYLFVRARRHNLMQIILMKAALHFSAGKWTTFRLVSIPMFSSVLHWTIMISSLVNWRAI